MVTHEDGDVYHNQGKGTSFALKGQNSEESGHVRQPKRSQGNPTTSNLGSKPEGKRYEKYYPDDLTCEGCRRYHPSKPCRIGMRVGTYGTGLPKEEEPKLTEHLRAMRYKGVMVVVVTNSTKTKVRRGM
ncbi:hypothetical protein PIB30_048196 [Stylosanthes scabra]|uniref:Uncharacterized protein n=1 Tax=Stylosanthes scabra TaxID=79078 RepID=A0ABU6YFK0_9FABA|nr:hypothetical protein [Stylosanthes scabra]